MLRYLFVPGNYHFHVACVAGVKSYAGVEGTARMEGAGLGESKNAFSKNPIFLRSLANAKFVGLSKKYQYTWICFDQSMQKFKFCFTYLVVAFFCSWGRIFFLSSVFVYLVNVSTKKYC